jgi:hypothetical protein
MWAAHFLSVWLLAAPASASGGSGPGVGQSAPPPPIPTTYRFEKDVAFEIIQDRNYDRRPDAWITYERGHVIHFQLDTDFDGQPDWREKWDAPPGPPGEHQLQEVDGRWRLIPSAYYYQILHAKPPSPLRYTGHTQKLVNGVWTGTFTNIQKHEHIDDNDIGDRKPPVRWEVTWHFKDGKPVEAVDPRSGHRITWIEGIPQREESEWLAADAQKHSSVVTYRNGMQVLSESFVGGKPVYRMTLNAGVVRSEAFRNGAWTADYEDLSRDAQGHVCIRYVYKDGVRTLQENLDPSTGKVYSRYTTRPDGGSINERADRDGNFTSREQYDRDGSNRIKEQLVDGKWTGDFVDTTWGRPDTYRGGRLVHFDQGNATISPEWMRVFNSPAPDQEEWSDGKHVRRWHTFVLEPGRMRRMIREARDLDGDGKPDVVADYEKLTVEQPPVAAPVQKDER